ncbi:hypothetical protein [Vibrio sp. D431a]|uniref:hypothetical protein n=1 Tax=Vibrio sp. D431a TaxID=2837388 RepID=UPI0025549C87|nr:hypothetical protein [Vibrio sp. D431a]MDK9793790.1 hypothetical protein [Vibrio sp. D431a]
MDKREEEFLEQMASALLELGTKKTLSSMARMLCAVATKEQKEMTFTHNLGVVSVKPNIKQPEE